jgi:hypothetical protein
VTGMKLYLITVRFIILCVCVIHISYKYIQGKGKNAPLYMHLGSVEAVRPIGGIEV